MRVGVGVRAGVLGGDWLSTLCAKGGHESTTPLLYHQGTRMAATSSCCRRRLASVRVLV